ncbi:hypothetical protein BN440_0745 [Erwinia amylovora MR1]|nr:hypothetical protein BN440_0745 [Erwinia amylovora MR1]
MRFNCIFSQNYISSGRIQLSMFCGHTGRSAGFPCPVERCCRTGGWRAAKKEAA